jgi:imidazolonepropionase-like amidohydrolase
VSPEESAASVLALTGATVLTGQELAPVEAATVLIEDGVIAAVGNDVPVPVGARSIDVEGLTLMPGFIDAHVHIGFYPPAEVLAGGVTTARDLAWPPELIFPIAEASTSKRFNGPRVLAAGPMLTTPGGYPTRAGWAPLGTGLEIARPQDAATAVTTVADQGAVIIKVALNPQAGPTLDLETLRAIVDAAHERGLKTTGHVFGLEELDKALDAGLDELAHMLMSPQAIPDATIERMVEQGMTVVPTLSVRFGRDRRIAIDNLRRFIAAGGRVIYGTDLGNGGPAPGIDRREVKAMAAAGMTGRDIIHSATVEPARWMGLQASGWLEPGMAADITGVKGDALGDPRSLTNVELVVRVGKIAREP